jgi:hypothetical protein
MLYDKNIDLSSWVAELKSEIAQNVDRQSKIYNFNFLEDLPETLPEAKFNWIIEEKVPFSVGKARPLAKTFNFVTLGKIDFPRMKIQDKIN